MSTGTGTATRQRSEIPGVYRYCDDWCEYCSVTARCTSHRVRLQWEARRGPDAPIDRNDMIAFTREVAAAAGDTTPGLDALLAGDPQKAYQPASGDEGLVCTANQYVAGAAFLLQRSGWTPPVV